MRKNIPHQRQQIRWITKRYPNAWIKADSLRKNHHDWPKWCFLPMDHWWNIARQYWPDQKATVENVPDVGRLAALGAWRITQGIYRFDPDLYAALIDTPLAGELPDELLYRLPEWCVYLETPGLTFAERPLIGVYAHVDPGRSDRPPELRLVLDSETDMMLFPIPIVLGQGSLINALQAIIDMARKNLDKGHPIKPDSVDQMEAEIENDARDLGRILSLILYLCADDADYSCRKWWEYHRPGKNDCRMLLPREHIEIHPVGERIGATLRKAQQDISPDLPPLNADPNDHRRPRPHIRRAHWHGYWTGPKDGEQKFVLKWIAPVLVNATTDELPTVVHRVKQ